MGTATVRLQDVPGYPVVAAFMAGNVLASLLDLFHYRVPLLSSRGSGLAPSSHYYAENCSLLGDDEDVRLILHFRTTLDWCEPEYLIQVHGRFVKMAVFFPAIWEEDFDPAEFNEWVNL